MMTMRQNDTVLRYRIVKLSCDAPERLMAGEICKGISRRFPVIFVTQKDAESHLLRHIKRHAGSGRQVIGYMIQAIYDDDTNNIYRQWSYTSGGNFLVEAHIDSTVPFSGRESQTLPFHKDDYVIAYDCGDIILGRIVRAPNTPAEVEKVKQRAQERVRNGEPSWFWLDSSDDSYVVDYINEDHGHPSVTEVFPLPFDASEIPTEVKAALHLAEVQTITDPKGSRY